MKITWIGHSCFRIESSGYTVVLDPYADNSVPGLLPVRETANLVLCSHGHRDHNASSLIKLQEAAENPFKITQIHTYNDRVKGMERGENTIHIMDAGAFKAVHFGDLGCRLEPGQLEQLKSIADSFFRKGCKIPAAKFIAKVFWVLHASSLISMICSGVNAGSFPGLCLSDIFSRVHGKNRRCTGVH